MKKGIGMTMNRIEVLHSQKISSSAPLETVEEKRKVLNQNNKKVNICLGRFIDEANMSCVLQAKFNLKIFENNCEHCHNHLPYIFVQPGTLLFLQKSPSFFNSALEKIISN